MVAGAVAGATAANVPSLHDRAIRAALQIHRRHTRRTERFSTTATICVVGQAFAQFRATENRIRTSGTSCIPWFTFRLAMVHGMVGPLETEAARQRP